MAAAVATAPQIVLLKKHANSIRPSKTHGSITELNRLWLTSPTPLNSFNIANAKEAVDIPPIQATHLIQEILLTLVILTTAVATAIAAATRNYGKYKPFGLASIGPFKIQDETSPTSINNTFKHEMHSWRLVVADIQPIPETQPIPAAQAMARTSCQADKCKVSDLTFWI